MRSRFIDRASALAVAIIISVYVTAQSSATTQNNNESALEEKFRARDLATFCGWLRGKG
jgi:hypothetical protein